MIQYNTSADSVRLWANTFGNKNDEACLFINCAGANTSCWSERLCSGLAEKGFFVITYDHRDFGYSDKLDFDKYPFDVMDLVKDAIKILDSIQVNKAHIIGHSIGGFIAQLLAIHYREKVISITSISSSNDSPRIPPPPDKTWEIFMVNNPVGDFHKDIKGFLPVWEYLKGTAEFDKELAVEYTRNLYARQEIKGALGESHVKAQESVTEKTEDLRKVKIPAFVIHGTEDYLVDKESGVLTSECIENSKLTLITDMGHIPFNEAILNRFENEIIHFVAGQN